MNDDLDKLYEELRRQQAQALLALAGILGMVLIAFIVFIYVYLARLP